MFLWVFLPAILTWYHNNNNRSEKCSYEQVWRRPISYSIMLPTPQGNADGGTRRGGMEGGTMQESVEGGATQGSEPGGARPKSGSKLKYSRHRPTSDDHGTSQSKLGKSHPKSGSKVKDSQHHQHEAAGPGNMEKSSSKGRPKSGSKVRDDERHDGVVEYGSRTPHNNSGRGRPKSGSNFRNDKGQQNRRPVNPEQMPQVYVLCICISHFF